MNCPKNDQKLVKSDQNSLEIEKYEEFLIIVYLSWLIPVDGFQIIANRSISGQFC